jgi:hypothetical protein
VTNLIRVLVYSALAVLGVGSYALATPIPPGYLVAGALALGLFFVVAVVVVPPLRYRYWRYHLDEHELELQRGLLVKRRTLVPLVRVQNVDTVQGPLLRYFGLSTVTVSTAAGTLEIPALSDAVADELRNQISSLARLARESL